MSSSHSREWEASDRKLRRELGVQQLFFISFGSIIGSGWLFATMRASAVTGPSAIISWIIGGILVCFIALNYAEVSCMLPRSGAVVRYPHLSHGGFLGFIMAWAFLLATVSVTGVEAEAAVQYAASYATDMHLTTTSNGVTILTGLGLVFAIFLMFVFFLINFFGVKFFGEFNRWVTWWKFAIPVITFVLLFFAFKGSNFTSYGGFAPLGGGAVFNAVAVSGIVFSYFGFRQGLDFGGEARNPQRDIPLATIGSVVVAAAIYVLLQIAFLGALDWNAAGVHPGDWAALSTSKWADGPLYHALNAAGIALLAYFAYVLLADAIISPSGTGLIYMGASTRVFYGMGMHRDLPGGLTKVSERYRIPWVALVASLIVGSFFLIPYSGWALLVEFITSATVLTFVMGSLQLQVMRRTAPDLERPFYLKGAWLLSPLGFLSGSMIFYWAGFDSLKGVVASVLIGLCLYAFFQAPARGRFSSGTGLAIGIPYLAIFAATQYFGPLFANSMPFLLYWALTSAEVLGFAGLVWRVTSHKREVHAAWWLMFMVLTLYLLSYYGSYGDLKSPLIPFPWDNLIALGIGLISYYWGVASGYQTEEMKELNESGTGLVTPEEEEMEERLGGGMA
ncbi:MAG: APC family permease [Rubrobacteraceae bacterium]|uniref:APC family permease n=1 Tax=Rubrobacter naiadicus TaxID=1392641 RepID=UPI00236079CD|nr:APC family permease [Rubrobacter naiadicus]MBX6764001.1 APC family permease [Rubrobacteraceae bacterium]MCL6438603.1 APC family permease [Rubrobacteraceae bacterium]